jgi:exonuclease SbcD
LKKTRPIRLIHTSDVHLETDLYGSGEAGDNLRLQVRRAFSRVIDLANERDADLILIVGDLFDSSRIPADALDFALGEINRAKMPVVMSPGNHDAHDEQSVYKSLDARVLPGNLNLILEPDGRLIEFDRLQARIWSRALIEHSPDYRPLSGIPAPSDDQWNIAMAHGLFTGSDKSERSSQITAEEVAACRYDYVALGHVHVFSDVSCGGTPAFYCGTPGPLNGRERNGTVALVELIPGRPAIVEPITIVV